MERMGATELTKEAWMQMCERLAYEHIEDAIWDAYELGLEAGLSGIGAEEMSAGQAGRSLHMIAECLRKLVDEL